MTTRTIPANIFIAGASGVVGLPLIRLLLRRGYRVFGLTRTAAKTEVLWQAGVVPVIADALDAAAIRQVMCAVRPDAVIHQLTDLPDGMDPAGMAEAIARNARIREVGTANLVAAAVAAGTHRLIAQSIGWAYAAGDGPADETRALDRDASGTRAITIAGVIALESAVLQTPGLRGTVLRYGQFYGPGTGAATREAKTLPLHVEAAAWAAVLALETGATGIFNVAEAGAGVQTDRARRELGWDETLRLGSRGTTNQPGQ